MGIWPHTLYAYPEEAHWYVMAVSALPPYRGTARSAFFFFQVFCLALD